MGPGGVLRGHHPLLAAVFKLIDAGWLAATLLAACAAHDEAWRHIHTVALVVAVVAFFVASEVGDLYRSWRSAPLHSEAWRATLCWLAAVAGLLAVGYATKTSWTYSRAVMATWFVLVPCVLAAWRLLVRGLLRLARRSGRNTRTVGIAGAGGTGAYVADIVLRSPWMGLRVVGLFDDLQAPGTKPVAGAEVRGDLDLLVAEARRGALDLVYVALPFRAEARIRDLIEKLGDTTASVYVVPDALTMQLLSARWTSLGEVPVVSLVETPFYGVEGWLKRAEDLLLASVALVLSSPVLLAIALAIRLSSRGPIIFRQRRYGLNGQPIVVWKFRTMTVCEDSGDVPQARASDPRVTALGRWLRRTSLDELPQLVNVLAGEMSLVGPRPHAVAHNEHYRRLIAGYMLRHKVRPGITGLAQVSGLRGETDSLAKMQARVELDLAYIRDWSLGLDLMILLRTVGAVIRGENAR